MSVCYLCVTNLKTALLWKIDRKLEILVELHLSDNPFSYQPDDCVHTGRYYTGKDCIHYRECAANNVLDVDLICADGVFVDINSYTGKNQECPEPVRPPGCSEWFYLYVWCFWVYFIVNKLYPRSLYLYYIRCIGVHFLYTKSYIKSVADLISLISGNNSICGTSWPIKV